MSRAIFFERLSLSVRIGTGKEERKYPQRLLASSKIYLGDLPWGNDSLAGTVDYDHLIREIVRVSELSEFSLLERLAECIVDHVMTFFPGVSGIRLALWKDPCPVPFSVGQVGVTIRQNRTDWEKVRQHANKTGRIT